MPAVDLSQPAPPPGFGLLRDALDRSAPQVRDHVQGVARRLAAEGASVQEVSLDDGLDLVLAVLHLTMQVEAAAVHWQLLEQFPGAHAPRLRAYVEVGRLLPGALYLHAQRLRRRIVAGLERLLAGVDALLLPTAVNVAPGPETTGDPSLQAPFSLAGLPAISLPSGLSEERLPLAVQLVSARWQEPRLLAIARWVELRLGQMPAPPL